MVERTQLIVTSDHGHVSGTERLDVVEALRGAGWPIARGRPGDGEIFVVPGAASFVYGVGARSRAERRMLDWLADQPWFGAAFTRSGGAGIASIDALGIAHPLQPDLVFTLRQSDEADSLGVAGICVYDADIPLGGGMHGGLHPRELANVLILSGSAFGPSPRRVSVPAGLLDVAPTALSLLGVHADDLAGHALDRMPAAGSWEAYRAERLAPAAARAAIGLVRAHRGHAIYLEGLDSGDGAG